MGTVVDGERGDVWKRALFVAAILVIAVVTGGFFILRHEVSLERAAALREVQDIGRLKASQVENWREDFASDGLLVAKDPFFEGGVREAASGRTSAALGRLRQRLAVVADRTKCRRAAVYFLDGRLLAESFGPGIGAADEDGPAGGTDLSAHAPAMASALAAAESLEPVFRDIYRGPQGSLRIDLLVPILGESSGEGPMAVLVLSRDPSTGLYPILAEWPVSSQTAEVLLVRREGDSALFISPLRHVAAPPLTVRVPLRRSGVPSVRAIQGLTGTVLGPDYREVSVLADMESIAASPWYLVAKIDSSEALQAGRRDVALVGLVAGLVCLSFLAAIFLAASRRESVMFRHSLDAEHELRDKEALYRHLFTDSVVPAILFRPEDGGIVDMNASALRFYGWNEEAFLGMKVHEFSLLPRATVEENIRKVREESGGYFRSRHRTASGGVVDVDVYSCPITLGNRELFYLIVLDETARVSAEKAREELLKEKEILLRELHHRTKNNLQVISSLIGLQALAFSDEAFVRASREMQGRIETMALAHEKLYRASDVSRIDLGAYIRDLSALLAGEGRSGIPFTVDCDFHDCAVSIEVASPCGLVINELIMNSLKHALPSDGRGRICIAMREAESHLVLEYQDNGSGLPEGFDPRKAVTLGLSLIASIVEGQLGGKLDFPRGPGFACRIEFDPGKVQRGRTASPGGCL